MAIKGKKISTKLKVIGATATVLFSLFSFFTGTLAWFTNNNTVTASGASVTVEAPEGVNFDVYYLHHFVIDQSTNKDGNYNSIIDAYSGYEGSTSSAVFEPVLFNDDGEVVDELGQEVDEEENPMMINHLWPAHRLTYAIVITGGDVSRFSLDSWDEETDENVMTTNDGLVSLSWAINIFSASYAVTATNNIVNDISSGFVSYAAANLTDTFTYSETSPAPVQHPAINVLPSLASADEGERTILYFSIEFSNSSDTFYELDNVTDGVSYYAKNTSGNSNCYERLSLKDLVFKLIQEKRK